MELFEFFRGLLAWMASVACAFPLNVPMLYLAQRIRDGQLAEDSEFRIDNDELWKRSALGALGVAGTTFAFLFVDVVFASWGDLPADLVHFVAFIGLIAAAAFVLMYFFAFEDYFAGLSLLTIYLGLPMIVLWIANLFGGYAWGWMVDFYLRFLKEIPR